MKENHKKFLSHLDESISAVQFLGDYLNQRGYTVRIPDITKASKHEEWQEHADDGDLFMEWRGKEIRIEVKHLSAEFTCRDDWPFGYKFIICAKHAWDRAKQKPSMFYILNKDMTHAALVNRSSKKFWYTEMKVDHRYDKVEQEFLMCPTDYVTFIKLKEK